MKIFLLNTILAIAWALLTGDVNALKLVEGFFIGYFVLYLTKSVFGKSNYFNRAYKFIAFLLYFLRELTMANLKIAYDIITPRDKMKPGIIAFELDAKTDFEIALLANLITLTPGTLSLDVSDCKKILYIHSVYIDDVDKFKMEIKKGLEKKILEVLR